MADLQAVNGDSLQWLVIDIVAQVEANVDDPTDRVNVARVVLAIVSERNPEAGPDDQADQRPPKAQRRGDRIRSRLRFEGDDQ